MRHGVDTTIVEIDPAVYNAAKTYFGLPDPGEDKVFLQDARGWVARRKICVQEGKCPLFDAAIHDCFSGGGVPQHLFTLEFWKDLRSIMHPDGVLVLVRLLHLINSRPLTATASQNFAGIVNSESTKLVFNTMMEAFGQCRAFHDYFEKFTDQTYNEEFLNMVRRVWLLP
jgi:spermidine synthase